MVSDTKLRIGGAQSMGCLWLRNILKAIYTMITLRATLDLWVEDD